MVFILGAGASKPKKVLKRATRLMEKANAILFLGFGYHPENMARLKVPFDRLAGWAKNCVNQADSAN